MKVLDQFPGSRQPAANRLPIVNKALRKTLRLCLPMYIVVDSVTAA